MKTILYNPIFINPQAYYVFPRLTRYLQPDNESTAEPANYIGTIEVKVIAYGDTTLKRTYTNTDSIDLSEFKNTWIRISLFTKVGSCVLGEWKIGNMESDLPYIDPEVLASLKAVVIVGNKTNNDSDRAIVKNLVDPDNPFVISNAAFKLNSGFGKYEEDFTSWIQTNGVIASSDKVQNSIVGRFLYFNTVNKKEDVPSFKVNITLGQQSKLQYNYIKEDGTSTYIVYSESGIYTIPASCFSKYTGGNAWFGFYQIEGTSIIEQIPSFEGAFVTDGINDLITSTKTVQEMLGGSNEITVVSMIHQIDGNVNYTNGYTNYIRHGGGFIRNSVSGINGKGFNKTGIYGYTSTQLNSSNMGLGNVINNILGDKDDYSFERSSTYTLDDAKYSVQNFVNANNQPSNEGSSIAWYWTIIANKVLTTDQINQVIAYFNLDRTLKPDILCNVKKQGITNENHAEFGDKLIDFSGNGRDIQLNNLAWKGGSGIAAKPFETIKDYTQYQDDQYQEVIIHNEFSYTTKSKLANRYWSIQSNRRDNESLVVTIITDKDCEWASSAPLFNSEGVQEGSLRKAQSVLANTPTEVTIAGMGYFEIPEGYTIFSAASYVNLPYSNGEVTVTFIPSYEGGVLLDGINDFGKVTGMPIYKDYTFITEREFLSVPDGDNITNGSLVSKSDGTGKGAFIIEEITKQRARESSFSIGTNIIDYNTERIISYQSKYSYNGKVLTAGQVEDEDVMWLGTIRDNDTRFINAAIYFLMSFPYSMSEFLIERQLKKHKLGTLYPDMVEFRPVIKANNDYEIVYTAIIKPNNWQEISIGDYVTVGESVAIQIKLNNPLEVTNVSSNSLADVSFYKEETGDNVYTIYGRLLDGKSPQKISLTIEQDENYVLFKPTINSNAIFEVGNEETMPELFTQLNNGEIDGIILYMQGDKAVLPNNWIDKNTKVRAIIYCLDTVSEEDIHFTVDGKTKYCYSAIEDGLAAFGIMDEDSQEEQYMTNVLTANTIDIQIDQYIRYEDIVQPYPILLRFNDENGNEVSWGGKFRVGSTITRIGSIADPESNLLNGLYSVSGLSLNGKAVTSSTSIVEKQMVFKTTATYLLDNNEPKVILSPSRLRIPNSSYKILGYIPDISGHGNHGVIHNSAYKLNSGANGYLVDFTTFQDDGIKGIVRTDSKIYLDKSFNYNQGFWLGRTNSPSPAYKVKISGIPETGMLTYTGGIWLNLVNGINELPARTNTEEEHGFVAQSPNLDWSNLVIEQIGEYEGAYCLDGVDDFVTIPTLASGGKQVLMKVNWQSGNGDVLYDQRTSTEGLFAITAASEAVAYDYRNAGGNTYIDGVLNKHILSKELASITHNIILNNDYTVTNSNIFIGTNYANTVYAKMALYDFMLFDEISTDDKIKELNEYVGIEGNTE